MIGFVQHFSLVGCIAICCLASTATAQRGHERDETSAQTTAAIYLETAQQIMDATRGVGAYADLPAGTTFIIRNGTYVTPAGTKAMMWIQKGGTAEQRRRFVGESRDGVVIVGRCTVESSYVDVNTMTFALDGFEADPESSFSTITVANARHVSLADLACLGTGDKGKKGGHIELMFTGMDRIPEHVLIENCLIEKFGRREHAQGKLDHGIYISAGRNVIIRNCEIRGNAGRGIQLYAHSGGWRRIHDVLIEGNRIHHNGRLPYTDGIVISTDRKAPRHSIADVTVRNNIIYRNAHAGIRFNSEATGNILIENNTFWHSGGDTDWGIELEVDRGGGANDVMIRKNIFVAKHVAAFGLRYSKHVTAEDNLVEGRPGELPVGRLHKDLLTDPENGDFSVRDPQWRGYGAQ